MIAHVAGMPIEELLVLVLLGASGFAAGARVLVRPVGRSRRRDVTRRQP